MAAWVVLQQAMLALSVNCAADQLEIAPAICMPFASDGDVMKHTPSINDTVTIERWLASGGRGIDSAWSYDHGGYGHSQRQMGIAIKQFTRNFTKLARSDLFVTTKIPCGAANSPIDLIKYDLAQLMLDYVDLVLIHTPKTCNSTAEMSATWAAMQMAVIGHPAGLNMARAIGVSNFDSKLLATLIGNATGKQASAIPAVNQCSMHVGSHDDATIAFCKEHGITYEAYSPLGHPNGGGKAVYDIPLVKTIAAKHNVTGAQVALRWLVQLGHPFVTAAGTVEYDTADLGIFGFSLDDADMSALTAFEE